jgi:ribonuclease BN (tRNA processing enzyme)
VDLTVLGTSGAFPGPGQACSGYLLRHDGFALVLDFGTGVLANVQRNLSHDGIGGIAISHQHPDHCMDLYPLFMARFFHPTSLPALPLVTGPGVLDRLTSLEGEGGPARMVDSFAVREVEPGAAFELGPFAVETVAMPHWVPVIGMRVTAGDRVLAYTGDTGPGEEVVELARGADLLIAEASWLDGQDEGTDPYHLTARQAGEHATKAGVGRLLLSHFWPSNPRRSSREQAGEAFDGELLLAAEGLEVTV